MAVRNLKVSKCRARKCPFLRRLRDVTSLYNTGPFYCAANKHKDHINQMVECPKGHPVY